MCEIFPIQVENWREALGGGTKHRHGFSLTNGKHAQVKIIPTIDFGKKYCIMKCRKSREPVRGGSRKGAVAQMQFPFI